MQVKLSMKLSSLMKGCIALWYCSLSYCSAKWDVNMVYIQWVSLICNGLQVIIYTPTIWLQLMRCLSLFGNSAQTLPITLPMFLWPMMMAAFSFKPIYTSFITINAHWWVCKMSRVTTSEHPWLLSILGIQNLFVTCHYFPIICLVINCKHS